MSSGNLHIQMRISYGVTNLLERTASSEHCEGATERDLACSSKTCCDTYHIALCDTAVEEAIRICFLKYACLGCAGKVSIQYQNVRILSAELLQRVAIAFSCCDLLYF